LKLEVTSSCDDNIRDHDSGTDQVFAVVLTTVGMAASGRTASGGKFEWNRIHLRVECETSDAESGKKTNRVEMRFKSRFKCESSDS
jgi:hypothetical protein